MPVRWTDLTVRHTGYVDDGPAGSEARTRYQEASPKRALADRPDDPFVLFNLGAIAIERHDVARGAQLPPPSPRNGIQGFFGPSKAAGRIA